MSRAGLAGILAGLAAFTAGCSTAPAPFVSPDAPGAPLEVLETGGGAYRVEFRTLPSPVPLNEPFEIELFLRRTDGAPLGEVECAVDATMPAHRHGMLREPTVEALGGGRFRARGMLLHMGGEWVLTFDVRRGARTERARFALEL